MRKLLASLIALGITATMAQAECTGSNGRGWGSGKGSGKFEMTGADKNCKISFPGFINDTEKTRIPATEFKLTRGPKNGTLSVAPGQGLIYTTTPGFKGSDKFCTRNSSPAVNGQTLSGCVTINVN